MRKIQKTKQGMASIYVVVFVTMLIGVITLSFLRIMLSESGRTEKNTLADSAMNSAMAGVEDAKTILTAYDQCIRGTISDKAKCGEVMTKVGTTDDNSCDLGVYSTGGETEIGFTGNGGTGSVNDQAYTCVNLTVKGDFQGEINNEKPVLVIPMRVEYGQVQSVEGVKISWKSSAGGEPYGALSSKGYDINNPNVNDVDIKGVLGKKGVTVSGSEEVSKANGLKVTLIQTDNGNYNINDFYASDGDRTDRATVMLLPTEDTVSGASSTNVEAMDLIKSADKTYNAPIAVTCSSDDLCVADLHFPQPRISDGGDGTRVEETFFLVVSRVYSEPVVENVTVRMFKDSAHTDEIEFFNVQPIVDSTGRAGDLVRRVEVRLGANAGQYVPLAELTVDQGLDKSFFVTKNCIAGTGECSF